MKSQRAVANRNCQRTRGHYKLRIRSMPDDGTAREGWHQECWDRFKRSRAKERRTRKSMTEAWRVKDGLATVKWRATPGRKQDGEKQKVSEWPPSAGTRQWWENTQRRYSGLRPTAIKGKILQILFVSLWLLWTENALLPQIIAIWVVFTIFVLVRSPGKGSPALVQCVWGRSGVTVPGTNGRTSAAKQ